MAEEHRHYWVLVGGKGSKWKKGHALARCLHCPAVTVAGYGEGIGPCPHVVSQKDQGYSPSVEPELEEVFNTGTQYTFVQDPREDWGDE